MPQLVTADVSKPLRELALHLGPDAGIKALSQVQFTEQLDIRNETHGTGMRRATARG